MDLKAVLQTIEANPAHSTLRISDGQSSVVGHSYNLGKKSERIKLGLTLAKY